MLNKKIGFGLVLMVLMIGSSIAAVSAIPNSLDLTGRADFIISDKTARYDGTLTQSADLKFYQGDSVLKEYGNLNLTSRAAGTASSSWSVFYGETIDDVTNETITPPAGATSYELYFPVINLASGKIPINEKVVRIGFENSQLDRSTERREQGNWLYVTPNYQYGEHVGEYSFVPRVVPYTAYDWVASKYFGMFNI